MTAVLDDDARAALFAPLGADGDAPPPALDQPLHVVYGGAHLFSAGLRDKLADNEATIRAHMGAVNEVADLLQDAIQRAQTDGTYSQQEFGQASPA